MNLVHEIEDLLETNANDFALSKAIKNYIKEYNTSLYTLFKDNQGKDFLVKHTKALDAITSLIYKVVLRRMFGNYVPMKNNIPIALVALGSYGREQLCVHSDIDLMLVYEKAEGYNINAIIERFLYLAWDAGLKLGHRVHEVDDLFNASLEDISIKTAFIESRFIDGSHFTWHATQKQLIRICKHEPKKFILEKINESLTRRAKFPFSMQPHLKECVGGLRDAQLLTWVATIVYGVTNSKELVEVVYSDEEYKSYRASLELIFRARSSLHLIAKKQQDILLLEHIPQVRKMLGFTNDMKFSMTLLHALWQVNCFTQIFIKKIIRTYIYEKSNIPLLRKGRIEAGVYALDNVLYASYHLKTMHINAALKLLLRLEDKAWKFDQSFLRLFAYVRFSTYLTKTTYQLIRRVAERQHFFQLLELFYNCGILHRLFFPFKKVLHLPQFDGYHQYPVDLHSIYCVRALENIKEPFLQALYSKLTKQEKVTLKLSVLLHDAGKGRKQHHNEVGAKLITMFMKKLDFAEEEVQTAALLIKHHTLMSEVAYRENIHNENTLYQFMSTIKSERNLTLLYLLTYADINGVGEGIYTRFISNLLKELFELSLDVSAQDERLSEASKRLQVEKRLNNMDAFQTLPKTLQKKLLAIESNLFFFKHKPTELLQIVNKAKALKTYSYHISDNGTLSLEIYRKIPINLGYLLGKLSYLDVASMEIATLFDGIKYFNIEFSNEPDENTKEFIYEITEDSFDMSKKLTLKKPVIFEHEVMIDCQHSLSNAELKVHTKNQKGLLAYIMQKLDAENINVETAKIHTTKYAAKDSFIIDKTEKMCDKLQKVIADIVTNA